MEFAIAVYLFRKILSTNVYLTSSNNFCKALADHLGGAHEASSA